MMCLRQGVDPSAEQWKELSALLKKKGHYIFFDAAYLGFASGDVNKDAFSLHQVESSTAPPQDWSLFVYPFSLLNTLFLSSGAVHQGWTQFLDGSIFC